MDCAYCGHPRGVHDGPCIDPSCDCAGYEQPQTFEQRTQAEADAMQYIRADLRGDGRQLVHPRATRMHAYPGNPKRVALRTARDVVAAFQAHGRSTHSPRGELCWIIYDWCAENQVGLIVTAYQFPGDPRRSAGWHLERQQRANTTQRVQRISSAANREGDPK